MRAALAIVCCFYFWAAMQFTFVSPNGYYNHLARGWTQGHLYCALEVDPRLLAQANPYDPNLPDEIKMHDMALFNGHYYLYHGPAPVLLAYYPYRVLTRKDLPDTVAVALFASIAFLANAFTLRRLRPGAHPALYLVLGLANGMPFLLHRIWVYEVAIAAAQATLSVALAFHTAGRLRATGLTLGLLALSRPHLLLVALFTGPRSWPAIAPGLGLAALHNYLRFGNPLDFGLTHLIAGPGQQVPSFGLQFILPSLYLFFLETPHFITTLPFVQVHNQPSIPLPNHMFHENMFGALWMAPFLVLRRPYWPLVWPALALCLFLSTTGWITERYLLDFLPLLVLASLAGGEDRRWHVPLYAFAIAVNLLLYIAGPYNDLVRR